jgi:hypothetical protein
MKSANYESSANSITSAPFILLTFVHFKFVTRFKTNNEKASTLNGALRMCNNTRYTQYCETNAMHFLFSLLRIKGLYMFRALLSYPQEALHKRHLVYCVCVMSVGCTRCSQLT